LAKAEKKKSPSWAPCYHLKNIFAEKLGEKLAILSQITGIYAEKMFLRKTPISFRTKAKIAQSCDHNPRGSSAK
jgi:hypothetical protein